MRTLVLVALVACTPNAPAGTDDDPGGDDDETVDDGTLVPEGVTPPDSPHLALGAPKDATPDDDYLVVHAEMALGYSHYLNAANWVSWRTRPEDFGPVPRFDGDFYPDDQLPADWFHSEQSTMNGSGYDRGHMLRSEERTRTTDANIATFVMTNVLPQRADLNRGPWFDFELYVQRKVQSRTRPRDAYVLAGPVWSAECATHAPRTATDGCLSVGRTSDPTRRIAVPVSTWKVVVFVDAGVLVHDAVDPYIVAVVMPNESGIGDTRWYDYRSTVADIERLTGYDLPSLE